MFVIHVIHVIYDISDIHNKILDMGIHFPKPITHNV